MTDDDDQQGSSAYADWGAYVPLPDDGGASASAHAAGAAAAAGGSVRARLARRRPPARVLVGAAVLLAGVIVAVVLVLALGGGGSRGANVISRAAAATGSEAGFRFTLGERVTLGTRTVSTTASGSYSDRPETQAAMSLTENGVSVAARVIGSDEYIRTQAGGWEKLDLAAVEQTLGVSSQGLVSQDPAQLLNFLLSTGSVTRVGTDTILGRPTTHYRAVAQLSRVVAASPASQRAAARSEVRLLERLTGSKTLPVEAWIDAQQRVRQVEIRLARVCTKAGTFSETVTLDYLDYGPQPSVVPPPEGQVTDVTDQAETQLRQEMAQFCTAS